MPKLKRTSYIILILNSLAFILLNFIIIKIIFKDSGGDIGELGILIVIEPFLFVLGWVGSIVSYYFLEKKFQLRKSTIFFLPLVLLIFPFTAFTIFMGWSLSASLIPSRQAVSPTIDQKTATTLVYNLPEVQAYLQKVPQSHVVYDHEDLTKHAWVIHVYEDLADHQVTFNWYAVDKYSREITKQID